MSLNNCSSSQSDANNNESSSSNNKNNRVFGGDQSSGEKRQNPYSTTPHPFKKQRSAIVGIENFLPSHLEDTLVASVSHEESPKSTKTNQKDDGTSQPPAIEANADDALHDPEMLTIETPNATSKAMVMTMMNGGSNEQQQQHHHHDQEDEEPDWDELAQGQPRDVRVFLEARAAQDAADERFATFLDEYHASIQQCMDALLQTAADIHSVHRDRLDTLEGEIRTTLLWNHEKRAKLQRQLQEGANAAQGLFAQLLKRISQPVFGDRLDNNSHNNNNNNNICTGQTSVAVKNSSSTE